MSSFSPYYYHFKYFFLKVVILWFATLEHTDTNLMTIVVIIITITIIMIVSRRWKNHLGKKYYECILWNIFKNVIQIVTHSRQTNCQLVYIVASNKCFHCQSCYKYIWDYSYIAVCMCSFSLFHRFFLSNRVKREIDPCLFFNRYYHHKKGKCKCLADWKLEKSDETLSNVYHDAKVWCFHVYFSSWVGEM